MRIFRLSLVLYLIVSFGAAAQDDDDRGFLTRTIEDALSGAGREVRIEGFQGALSSEASFEQMTIADSEGTWLTLDDVTLIWSRTALLRGRLQVNELRAGSLSLPRLPVSEEAPAKPPSAEAGGFELALPDLPVSVNIESFEVASIALGEPIIGVPVELNVKAAARLDDSGLDVDLSATRIDEVAGLFSVVARVARETSLITLDIGLDEDPGGIVARLLNLPGQPSTKLDIEGEGPLSDFSTQINLTTDSQPRLEGAVSLLVLGEPAEGQSPDRQVKADLSGDITALIAPDYQEFFGPDVGLSTTTLLVGDGSVDVQSFDVTAKAVDLSGQVRLNSDLWPEFIDVEGEIAQGGQPVLLPGTEVTVNSVDLDVAFDAALNDQLAGQFVIDDFNHDALRVESLTLGVDGRIDGAVSAVGELLVDISLDATGVEMNDASMSEALGSGLTGQARVEYADGQPTRISDLRLEGADYGVAGDAVIQGLNNGFPTELMLSVNAQDLTRFNALAQRDLSGAADLEVSGKITPLAGVFDLDVVARTQDLAVDVPQADALLTGETNLSVNAKRDETGTFVRDLLLKNAALDVAANAQISSTGSDIDGRLSLSDVGLVLPQYEGALDVRAVARQEEQAWWVDAAIDAPYDSEFTIQGFATGPEADVVFDLSIPDFGLYVPQAKGPLVASGRVNETGNGYAVDVAAAGPFDGTLDVKGVATGPEADLSFQTSVPDVAAFLPQFSGPLKVEGDIKRAGERYAVDTALEGPAGTVSTIAGTLAPDASDLDLAIKGAAPLGLSGPFLAPRSLVGTVAFDLGVQGAPSLEAVRGTISTSDASFSAPNLRLGLQNMDTSVALSDGVATIDLGADIVAGGRAAVNGTLDLVNLVADIAVQLRRAVLVDPRLYSATLDADLAANGALTGGALISGEINLNEVNVTVPGSNVTSVGSVPIIRHVGSSRDVSLTRLRAGVVEEEEAAESASDGPVFPLDIKINAPNQIFVRGRGINAELAGTLEIEGTTGAPISSGEFELVRGRMDVIAKRFDLDEGTITFQGSLTPYINFISTTEIPDGVATITVEGLATEPEISFTSSPEAPEDEVLSLIIFGRYVSELSAFQALQLANGLAVLAGRSGIGIIGSLRSGVGLDELDVTTTESGETEISAGKYLTDDIYTDVTTSATAGTDVSVNIDLTDDLTGRATVGSEGDTSVGLFFQRDY